MSFILLFSIGDWGAESDVLRQDAAECGWILRDKQTKQCGQKNITLLSLECFLCNIFRSVGFQFSRIWDAVGMKSCGVKVRIVHLLALLLSWGSQEPCIVSLVALCLIGFQALLLCSRPAKQTSLGMANLCRAIRLDSSTRISILSAPVPGIRWDLFSYREGAWKTTGLRGRIWGMANLGGVPNVSDSGTAWLLGWLKAVYIGSICS